MICVCILLDGDVDIVIEEDLVGNFVKAHGHFEFMLRRGNKAVCIVEAKKDDIEQDLVGCEVAAEVGGLDIVNGIVTNYIQWILYCFVTVQPTTPLCTFVANCCLVREYTNSKYLSFYVYMQLIRYNVNIYLCILFIFFIIIETTNTSTKIDLTFEVLSLGTTLWYNNESDSGSNSDSLSEMYIHLSNNRISNAKH